MSVQVALEKKHSLLRNRLDNDLKKKRALELRINAEFERLKHIEGSIARNAENQDKSGLTVL